MLRKKLRHTRRYQEIINAFLKNGFSHFLYRIGLTRKASREFDGDAVTDMNNRDIGRKLRQTFQELGPTFIKLGQLASTQRDSIPKEVATELEKLQDEAISIPYEQVKKLVEEELGDSLENLFADFSEAPLATASIGQVHTAHLHTGEELAIKIQRPAIEDSIETDLEILHGVARIMEERISWARTYNVQERMDEFTSSLRDELDYTVEGRNAERVAKQFKNQSTIHIPKIYWDFTTKKVLTMERINGIKISKVDLLDQAGYNRKLIAKRLANAMFRQALEDGFFHGDPHAGNIYILPDNVISFIDFGMMGRLGTHMRHHFAALMIYLQQGNSSGIIKTFTDMEILDDETNVNALQRDLDNLIAKYYEVSLVRISLGEVMLEIFAIAYRYQVKLPADITILGKAILTLEDIMHQLDPEFSIMKAVEPYGKNCSKSATIHERWLGMHGINSWKMQR
ncbi:AarF/ABC1/UbiB kinase family protein [Virgibacillus sp. 179-BFC.A HS]|uniref:AarF/ABC1/UbiB kinase family protein n=1 Tax=Tigheibacillus jepli TaxID=3035914 RepID=A0ABU5CF16_9BACI|nr:AarF/ABC1/UbiB kinase family protein [Virgibacillus sp. 179-BFC.A HS]MDY0404927.1 AarF/ABC1/UbiB kinase family protein [Virgibacillus sp. 179-BFC.A HS]